MHKIILVMLINIFFISGAKANPADYLHKFDINMAMELSDIDAYISKQKKAKLVYDKGYISRFDMGKKFKKEFSRTIKRYGMSESRIKSNYEDDLMEMINMLPKEAYPYIGPMLHKIPGMSEKILNLPGIKETKNKFPDKVNEKYMGIEDIEFLSPALYFVLMPNFWEKDNKIEEIPEDVPAKLPKRNIKLPDYLLPKKDEPILNAENIKASGAVKEISSPLPLNERTLFPTLVSPLTTKDAKAFISTMEDIVEWGNKNNKKNLLAVINAAILLDNIEQDKGTALQQNGLKDIVNPCQRLVLKIRVAGLYNSFAKVVASKGFSPEEWAYTGDKTIKAFRVAEINHSTAYAVQYHRRGYYDEYIKMLPEKWREQMYETQAAIMAMYAVFHEDVMSVKPIKEDIRKKFNKLGRKLLLEPIIY